jgi:hypothetical protein
LIGILLPFFVLIFRGSRIADYLFFVSQHHPLALSAYQKEKYTPPRKAAQILTTERFPIVRQRLSPASPGESLFFYLLNKASVSATLNNLDRVN